MKLTEALRQLLSEGKGDEYGCLMLDAIGGKELVSYVNSVVEPSDLHEYGIEDTPHVTVLYGFVDSVNPLEVIKCTMKFGPIQTNEIQAAGVSAFTNPDSNVLKVDVISSKLSELNGILDDKFPNENKYPEYHAHLTLAYLRPDVDVTKYTSNQEFVANVLRIVNSFPGFIYCYSTKDNNKFYF